MPADSAPPPGAGQRISRDRRPVTPHPLDPDVPSQSRRLLFASLRKGEHAQGPALVGVAEYWPAFPSITAEPRPLPSPLPSIDRPVSRSLSYLPVLSPGFRK
eukprot:314502-Prymnesium_polylepis.1